MTKEKAIAILDEVLADYESKNRRDVVLVLRAAAALLAKHGMPGAATQSLPSRKP